MESCFSLDESRLQSDLDTRTLATLQSLLPSSALKLDSTSSPYRDYLGWHSLPLKTSDEHLEQIQDQAQAFRERCNTFVLLGVGGSYLGARSAIEIHQALDMQKTLTKPRILYAGYHLSAPCIHQLLQSLEGQELCLNVVSKSGSTLETSITFELLFQYMIKRYSTNELKKRIMITTDSLHGNLRQLAELEGYPSLPVPSDIGGRYSVLTPVGLFPMALAGIDIKELLRGARTAQVELQEICHPENPASRYALLRNSIPKSIEILATFEPFLDYLAEWWKQLFGESEGKMGCGLFPSTLSYTTDLHSMGQYLQQGKRLMMETFLSFRTIPGFSTYITDPLSGKSLNSLQQIALKSTLQAHNEGGVPCLHLEFSELSPFTLGYLYYFFQKACAISALLLGVHPFTQEGVESYKKHFKEGLKA